ncbi:hypothetical protein JTB14_018535 [Gonioctena quinquepunctata]|nr:hypothetical protein JTB14_018535 [Gonioctena quinquepunctata]
MVVNPQQSTSHVANTVDVTSTVQTNFEETQILSIHIVGLLFLEENLNDNLYSDMLQATIDPLILQILEENENEFQEHVTFQQDRTAPHFQRRKREYLDVTYPMRPHTL